MKDKKKIDSVQLAKKLNVSPALIRDLAMEGKLPYQKISRYFMFEEDVIKNIIPEYDDKMIFITEKDAARGLGITRKRMKSIAKEGKCRRINLGRVVRYVKSDIDELIRTKKEKDKTMIPHNHSISEKIEKTDIYNKDKNTVKCNKKSCKCNECNSSDSASDKEKQDNGELVKNILQLSLCSAYSSMLLLNSMRERLEEVISFISDLENLSAKDKSYYNGTVNMDNLTFHKNTLIEIARTMKEHEDMMISIESDLSSISEEKKD